MNQPDDKILHDLRQVKSQLLDLEAHRDKLEEARRDAIIAAREAGMSMRAIAAEVGLTSGRISQIIDRSR